MANFRLPRLPLNTAIITIKDSAGNIIGKGYATTDFQRWWQSVCEAAEKEFGALEIALEAKQDAAASGAAAVVALAAADTANTAATTAQSAAAASTAATAAEARLSALQTSTVSPGTVISAAEVGGTSVTITIPSHTRSYGDGSPPVSVTGGTVTGQPYSSRVYVFYDQASRAGGAVTYQGTTSQPGAFATTAAPDRHYVGLVDTPAHLGANTTGASVAPGGTVQIPGNNLY